MSLAAFFQQRIFAPLGMTDTGFSVPKQGQDRFAALYAPAVGGDMSTVGSSSATVPQDQRGGLRLMEGSSQSVYFTEPSSHSGGGGLVGTIGDYARFCQILQQRAMCRLLHPCLTPTANSTVKPVIWTGQGPA